MAPNGKDPFPVVLHAHDRPTPLFGFVPAPVELADRRFAIISELAFGVGVVDEEAEAKTGVGHAERGAQNGHKNGCETSHR